MSDDPNCVFCKIVRGEIPSRKVYEDDDMLAFHDINPLAPVHFMLIPKRHVASLYEVTADGRGRAGQDHDDGRAGSRVSRGPATASARSSTPAGWAGRTSCTSTFTSSAAASRSVR